MITYITNLNFKKTVWLLFFLKKSILIKKNINKPSAIKYNYLLLYTFFFSFIRSFKRVLLSSFLFNKKNNYLLEFKLNTFKYKLNFLNKFILNVNNCNFNFISLKKKYSHVHFFFSKNYFFKKYFLNFLKITLTFFIFFFNHISFCFVNTKYLFNASKFWTTLNKNNSKNFFNETIKEVLNEKDEELEFNLKNLYKKKYFVFLNRYLINFLQFLFKIKIHLSFKKLCVISNGVENLYNYDFIVYTIKKHSKKLKNIKFIQTFLKILWISMKIKDSKFFLSWLVYRAELMFFKLHKFIPYLLNIIFKYFSKILFYKTQTRGIFFSMSGKISLAGDSKKKNVFC